MKRTFVAAVSIGSLLLMSSVASAQVCVLGIFAAAAYVSAHENRELTSKEAMSCGLSYIFDKPKQEPVKKKSRRPKPH